MKKSLLLFLALTGSVMAASAFEMKEPVFYSNTSIQYLSPNGKWAASEVYGTVVLINVNSGETKEFECGETGSPYYNLGLGNILSNNGIMLCSTETISDATYWDGEWKTLDTGDITGANSSANGITPDGRRICGNLGLISTTLDDVTMIVPAVWDRQADGSYGKYTLLPHPELDFTGRAPQYITAIAISDDGRTVVGQIEDCRGAFQYPIVYTEGADGKWSYTLPTSDLINPGKVELPENPGESPDTPKDTDYIDPENFEAYSNAYDAWIASGYSQDLFPDPLDYMTDEKRAEYEKALADYDTAYAEWSAKYSAFDDAYWEIVSASPNFEFNQVAISADGKSFAMTHSEEGESDPMSWMPASVNHVWAFDLTSGAITKYEDLELSVKAFAGEYITAVATDPETMCYNGYLLKDGQATSLYDFLCAKSDDVKEWVDLNMSHDVEVYDWENDITTIEKYIYTGLPVASADLSVVASWTQSIWGDYSPESYLFDFRDPAGIHTVAASGKGGKVTMGADGNLHVGEGVASLTVYGLGGECVMHVANPGQTVTFGLAPGVYVVKTDNADGSNSVTKVVK